MNKEKKKSLFRFVEEGDEAKIKEMDKYEGKEGFARSGKVAL